MNRPTLAAAVTLTDGNGGQSMTIRVESNRRHAMRARVLVAALIVVAGLCVSIPTAVGAAGTGQTGSPVSLADLAGSFSGTTTFTSISGTNCNGDTSIPQNFDAAYSGSAAVGVVTLHIQGCVYVNNSFLPPMATTGPSPSRRASAPLPEMSLEVNWPTRTLSFF